MKKKKIIAMLLALSVFATVALTGCSDEEYEDDYTAETSFSEENGEETTQVSNDSNNQSGISMEDMSIKRSDEGITAESNDSIKVGGDMEIIKNPSQMDENPNRAVRRNVKPVKFRPGRMLDGTPLPESCYLYRSTFNEAQQKAYDEIRNALLDAEAEIYPSVPYNEDSAHHFFNAVYFDDPELFYVTSGRTVYTNGNGVVTKIVPQYNELVNDIEGNRKRIEQAAAEAMGDLWILKYDIEKMKYAHDYLTNTCTYQLGSPHNQDIYSTFVNRVTVCAGFSKGFQYMMHKNGIPCATVFGDAGGPHGWNLVKGGNDFYAMDVTWDNDDSNSNIYKYDFFCITDQQIMNENHFREGIANNLPDATGTVYNYNNIFGGNCAGTNFDAIQGQLPNVNNDVPQQDENNQSDDDWWKEEKDNNQMDNGDGQGWWNLLDPSWTKDNWSESESIEGHMEIYDEQSHSFYLWEKGTNNFYAIPENSETLYMLNMDTYEWVECED